MASNMFPTKSAQGDQVAIGDWLCHGSSNYQVQSFLGQGTFGTVAKCMRMADKKTVAIKILKNHVASVTQAKQEVSALLKLRLLDSDKCNLVRWFRYFICRGYVCLEFEHLDKSLFDFMKERYFRPLLLKEIRPIVQQLATALGHLKAAGIIHADLKLANVMLVNHVREPFRVKVIDFGLAGDVSAAKRGSYIQTRHFRSPEIILGLPFTEAIDMWSLGCIAAALYLGTVLYPGSSEYDMIRYIVETQGQPPDNLLTKANKTGCFFQTLHKSTTSLYKLKTPEQYYTETKIQPQETRRTRFSSLYDLINIRVISCEKPADTVAEYSDLLMFLNMLIQMLELDAANRITPSQVLEHQFTSMHHMVSMYTASSHVQSCFEIMGVCQKKTSDSGKAVSGSLQQPSSEISNLVQQNLPSSSAERRGLSQPDCIKPHPCTSTQTAAVKAGMKRKRDGDDTMSETSNLSKRVRSECHGGSCAGPSTFSNSSNCIQASTAVRSHPAQPLIHQVNAQASKSTQNQSRIEPRIKRKADDEDVGRRQTDSDYYKSSNDDRNRSHAGPSTPGGGNQTQSWVSPRVKKSRAHDEDSDYLEGSEHKSKRIRKSYEGLSTSRSRGDSTNALHVGPAQRSTWSKQHHSAHASPSSAQAESCIWRGLKRKAEDDEKYVLHRKKTSDHSSAKKRKRSEMW
ncbi:hypothetical protein FQN60_007676 [Etheostoma spectabile]|uniref:Protein kinase domain-containing protein n=1 Tax=Etheostoma spectabile TaxID=54343 RepID=A0A5J5CWF2_9PERO|nr:hypothetical protein FQN60_007676 [Etheostoma spectabile]